MPSLELQDAVIPAHPPPHLRLSGQEQNVFIFQQIAKISVSLTVKEGKERTLYCLKFLYVCVVMCMRASEIFINTTQ